MKITQVETIRLKAHTRLLWLLVKTDSGISGWGESCDKVGPARTAIHETCSHFLLGRDPRDIEKIWQDMFTCIHFHGYAAVEMRSVSTIDIALWDILSKITELAIYRLLGGITETKMIATMAAAYNVPIAPHYRGGPGTFYASMHLCLNLGNVMVCEAVPENYLRFYEQIVEQNIPVDGGYATLVDRPGLGTELRADLLARDDVEHEATDRPNEGGKSPVHKLVRGKNTSGRPPSET